MPRWFVVCLFRLVNSVAVRVKGDFQLGPNASSNAIRGSG
jgi:hypothetical protein